MDGEEEPGPAAKRQRDVAATAATTLPDQTNDGFTNFLRQPTGGSAGRGGGGGGGYRRQGRGGGRRGGGRWGGGGFKPNKPSRAW